MSEGRSKPATPLGSATRKRFAKPATFVVKGQMMVDGCERFNASVCTITTGRTLPGSVPKRGFKSATWRCPYCGLIDPQESLQGSRCPADTPGARHPSGEK